MVTEFGNSSVASAGKSFAGFQGTRLLLTGKQAIAGKGLSDLLHRRRLPQASEALLREATILPDAGANRTSQEEQVRCLERHIAGLPSEHRLRVGPVLGM